MHKVSQVLAAFLALAICAFMTYLTIGAGFFTMIYNVVFLCLMLLIIAFAFGFGFLRMRQTIKGLDTASKKLISVYQNKTEMAEVTRAGAQIFEVNYLDRKYQEYLAYLRKTNSPCDIGDYIGEYEINNYTHRRLVEMVPDVLTSLGILGTFMGLVWGLRGFNPVSYEAMASSITSLIDGIKVAFVTSIYGISLSLAYTYIERGYLTQVSESLDNFLDKYYLCAVTPTDATAMNHVLSNQKSQIRAIEGMGQNISDQLAVSMADHMDPVMMQMNATLEQFTETVTMNQQELFERMASQVTTAMKRELYAEFAEMRSVLQETNKAQREYVSYLLSATSQFEQSLGKSTQEMSRTLETSAKRQEASAEQLQLQQEHLTQFVDYMSQTMQSMSSMTDRYDRMIELLSGQVETMEKISRQSSAHAESARRAAAEAEQAARAAEHPPVYNHVDDIDILTDKLDEMIALLEKQQKTMTAQQKTRKGLFR